MRTTRKTLAILAVLVAGGLSGTRTLGQEIVTVSAEDVTTTKESSQVAELQGRLEALEAQLQHGMSSGYEGPGVQGGPYGPPPYAPNGGCGCGGHYAEPTCGCGQPSCGGCCDECTGCCDCCQPCCQPCCRRPGPFVEAEAVYVKPHSSSGTGFDTVGITAAGAAGVIPGIAPVTVQAFPIDTDYEITTRFSAGWQLADGFGVRGRYWEFDQTEAAPGSIPVGFTVDGLAVAGAAIPVDVFHNWNAYLIDLEAFDSTDFGGWAITWSGGFRFVEYEENRGIQNLAQGPVLFQLNKSISGIGLTSSLEFRRQVIKNAGAFANFRASMTMGDETNNVDIRFGALAVSVANLQRNDVKYIYEIQVGGEYTIPLCGGAYLFGRGGAEVQFWDNFGTSTTTLLADESTGFGGFFAAAGVAR